MKSITWSIVSVLLLTSAGVFADDDDILISRANRFFAPLPDAMPGAENDTPERIALGKQLYFDKRLSINDSQSCASCHRSGTALGLGEGNFIRDDDGISFAPRQETLQDGLPADAWTSIDPAPDERAPTDGRRPFSRDEIERIIKADIAGSGSASNE